MIFSSGLGWGFTFTAITGVVVYYFRPKYHGFVLGLTSTGYGTTMIVIPPLAEWSIEQYGYQGTLLLLVGINLQLFICAAILRPTPAMITFMTNKTGSQRAIWSNLSFVYLSVEALIYCPGLSVVFVQLAYSVELILNVDRGTSGLVISVVGISNVVARIVVGAIVQLPGVDSFLQCAVQIGMTGGAVLLVPFVTSMPMMMFAAVLIGFGSSFDGSVLQMMIEEIVGEENLTAGVGAINVSFGVGLFFGSPIAGLIYDLSHDYNYTLYFGSAAMLLCMLMMFPTVINRRRQRQAKAVVTGNATKHNTENVTEDIRGNVVCIELKTQADVQSEGVRNRGFVFHM